MKCDGEYSHGRKRRATEVSTNNTEKVIELQKEIIVSGPLDSSSSVQKGKRLESVHQIGMLTVFRFSSCNCNYEFKI